MVSVKAVRRIGAVSLIVPTGDHLISPTLTVIFAPTIMQTMFGPGWISAVVFFIVLGAFQVFAIWSLLKSSSSSLLAVGVLVNFVSILIYLISASGVTIFGVPPQPLIAFGVLIKALETIFVLASLYLMKNLPRA